MMDVRSRFLLGMATLLFWIVLGGGVADPTDEPEFGLPDPPVKCYEGRTFPENTSVRIVDCKHGCEKSLTLEGVVWGCGGGADENKKVFHCDMAKGFLCYKTGSYLYLVGWTWCMSGVVSYIEEKDLDPERLRNQRRNEVCLLNKLETYRCACISNLCNGDLHPSNVEEVNKAYRMRSITKDNHHDWEVFLDKNRSENVLTVGEWLQRLASIFLGTSQIIKGSNFTLV